MTLDRPGALAITHLLRVGRPAAGAQLFINDGAGGRLSEINVSGGLLGLLLPRPLLRGGLSGGALEGQQVGDCGVLLCLGLLGQALHFSLFFGLLGGTEQSAALAAQLLQFFHTGPEAAGGAAGGVNGPGLNCGSLPKPR